MARGSAYAAGPAGLRTGHDSSAPGRADVFVPAGSCAAPVWRGHAGKFVTEGGLLVVTWALGDRLLDTGFRADRAAEHAGWVEADRTRARTARGRHRDD